MYPYNNRLQWTIQGRQKHLIRIVKSSNQVAANEAITIRKLQLWLRVKLVFLILLSLGVTAAVTSLVVDAISAETAGSGDEVGETVNSVLQLAARISGSISGILTLGLLFAQRVLGQYEIDLLASRAEGARAQN